ncbi:helix-turn-helix domain-containing protein [Amycolatopsis circi]|uniref:helix-turn-helix domain-containing protein n=1 Tax=Amycolatopsis circi TaxID=871959 RepID=UPI0013BE92E4|nr:hypothetical protein [Amycolatopsis circi]
MEVVMIKNNRQLAVAREKLLALEASADEASDDMSKLTYMQLASDIRREIMDYESVKSGQIRVFAVSGLDDLGESVVRARLASGLTQKELAGQLDVSEQMVQKDESRSYESAGVARVADVIDALGYELIGTLRPKPGVLHLHERSTQNNILASSEHEHGSSPTAISTHPASALGVFGMVTPWSSLASRNHVVASIKSGYHAESGNEMTAIRVVGQSGDFG